ncbi:MAG: chorismate mutase [Thermoanaerobaculia bacterium]
MRGVRGATTVSANDAGEIVSRTGELLARLVAENGIRPEDVASAVFTVTDDLDAEFPAAAVRSLDGWADVPLLCAREIPVPGSLGRCVRILLHWNTDRPPAQVRHVFLRGARELRPRWAVRTAGDDGEEPVRLPAGKP